MEIFGKIALGFFVGVLCGLVPLIYGIIKKSHKLAVLGILLSALCGSLFSFLDKSPFSAFVVAILFVVIIIANQKHNAHRNSEDEDDDFDNDIT